MTKRVALNIRGVYYETYEQTLSRFPNTLLGNMNLRKPYWDVRNEAFYFDRNQHLFDSILFFYQSGGIISKPECIDDDEFQDELRFFGIIKDQADIDMVNRGRLEVKEFIWLLTNFPTSSLWSKIFALLSTIVIIISTITYCMETAFISIHDTKVSNEKVNLNNNSQINLGIRVNYNFFIFETIYVAWFALEYVLRLVGHPNKTTYLFSLLGFVDLMAILPYFVLASKAINRFKAAIRTLKFLQIFRILKISRYNKSLQLLGKSLYYCKGQISLLLIFFFINCLACGSVLYWVERTIDSTSTTSLMDTIWFCIVSMTTVGYGDIVPRTSLGKLMAAITILVGIIILFHIFIPVYLSYFALLYEISVLRTLETNQNEEQIDTQEQDEYKNHRRKSISSSVRKSYASMGISSSVCVNEAATRRPSANMAEDTVMRKLKYEYLRKLSSIESPLSTSQKSLEVCDTSVVYFNKVASEKPTMLQRDCNAEDEANAENDQVESSTVSKSPGNEMLTKRKGRRKAVYEQPSFSQKSTQVNTYTGSRARTPSFSIANEMTQSERRSSPKDEKSYYQ